MNKNHIINYFSQKVFVLFLFLLLIFVSCSEKKSTEPIDEIDFISDNITVGDVTEEISESIGVGGGTIIISNPNSKINGLTITIPQDGYKEMRNYSISSAQITSHKLGTNFNPLSPMISIKNGGGYSDVPLTIKVPIQKTNDDFAIGFLYDEITGKIEALPIIAIDDSFITVESRGFHLSTVNSVNSLEKTYDNRSVGNLIISFISESVLQNQTVISSGFTPGVDDWEFINYGSYISPGGHCAGQSITAMWYFYEKKLMGEPSLFHRFDKVNSNDKPSLLWQDNPLGYRLASTVQEDAVWGNWEYSIQKKFPDKLVWKTFLAAMLITGNPQFVGIVNTQEGGGHAMIVYKINVSDGKLFVADPNYPNNRSVNGALSVRTIKYINNKFEPYPSFANAGEPGKEYDQIRYFSASTFFDWNKIEKRYKELENNSIGDDLFPSYKLSVQTSTSTTELIDGMTVSDNKIKLFCENNNIPGFLPGTNHLQRLFVFDESGSLVTGSDATGIAELELPLNGESKFGFYVCGYKNGKDNKFYNFNWYSIKHVPKINGDAKILQSNKCSFRIHFDGLYKYTNDTTKFEREETWGSIVGSPTGSFSGNTFTGSYDESLGSSNYKGNIVVTLNDDYNLVTSIDWTEDYSNIDQGITNLVSTSSFSGTNIPVDNRFDVFTITEDQTCNNISLLEHSAITLNNGTLYLDSYTCNRFSFIQLFFSEE